MQELTLAALMALLNILGGHVDPREVLSDWTVPSGWVQSGDSYTLDASSTAIADQCRAKPNGFLLFPAVIHSAHKIGIDGRTIHQVGDFSFEHASPFYEQVYVRCGEILDASVVQWKVSSYSYFFARLSASPKVVDNVSLASFFGLGANAMAGGALVILAMFSLLIYYGRVSNSMTLSVSFGSLILSMYFLSASNHLIGMNFSMIVSHKLADIGLWLGGILFLNAFRIDGLLRKDIFLGFTFFSLIGITIIMFGESGDQVQFGTMIPMLPCVIACLSILGKLLVNLSTAQVQPGQVLKFLGISFFLFAGLNDISMVTGIYDSYPLLSLGIVFGVLGLSVAVNQEIENTYKERDSLLKTLEDKVAEKTRDLQQTLHSLQGAQAELVQSAKLASLGTLSAGIAHEINNSINYVSGALVPLERRVMASASESDKVLFTKLFAAIKEGTTLTVEIVRSLRNFTGLNQAAAKEVAIQEVFTSVLTILKSKLAGVKVTMEVEKDLTLFGNLVGLNQMFMNLITNAIDAMPVENPELKLVAFSSGDQVVLEVIDNGAGMSAEVQKKIFDPFFTTKDVGKGTGLGLHIVTKEVERHKGKIALKSELGGGTKFTITLPKVSISDQEAA